MKIEETYQLPKLRWRSNKANVQHTQSIHRHIENSSAPEVATSDWNTSAQHDNINPLCLWCGVYLNWKIEMMITRDDFELNNRDDDHDQGSEDNTRINKDIKLFLCKLMDVFLSAYQQSEIELQHLCPCQGYPTLQSHA